MSNTVIDITGRLKEKRQREFARAMEIGLEEADLYLEVASAVEFNINRVLKNFSVETDPDIIFLTRMLKSHFEKKAGISSSELMAFEEFKKTIAKLSKDL